MNGYPPAMLGSAAALWCGTVCQRNCGVSQKALVFGPPQWRVTKAGEMPLHRAAQLVKFDRIHARAGQKSRIGRRRCLAIPGTRLLAGVASK